MIGLRLTDGLTTLDFQAGSYTVNKFTPASADRDVATVDEEIEIEIVDGPYAQVQIRAIQQMITYGRERAERGHGRRVFLEFKLGTAGELYWRSEVVDGYVELPEDDYQYDLMSGVLAFAIHLTRVNFWEDTSETGVTLQTAYADGTSGTPGSPITIYGHQRLANSRTNLLRCIASSITGDMPTPARFVLTNNYSSGAMGDVIVGHMLESDTDTLENFIEGETSAVYGSSTEPSSATNSAGVYYNLIGSGSTEVIMWSAAMSSNMLEGFDGNDFNIMIRMPSGASASDVLMRASIATDDGLSGLIERWSGRETLVPTSGGWLTLGRVQLPPRYLTGQIVPAPLRLRLYTQRLAGGSYSIPIDYVLFMPTHGWRKYRRHSYGLDPGVALNDRPYDGTPLLYTSGWAEGKLDNFVAEGNPIMLTPARNNLLCFAFTNTDTVLRSMSVAVYYRQRRLTV